MQRLLAAGGVDVNAVSPDLYSHATPVHHAGLAADRASARRGGREARYHDTGGTIAAYLRSHGAR